MREIEVRTDVTDVVGIGERLETVATVRLPDEIPADPVVCFAWPGGGYSRRYFTADLVGGSPGGQAGWHTARGWIVVACDYLHAGDSTACAEPTRLTFENLAAADRATVDNVLAVLERVPRTLLGIGHSLGGCLLTVQQGRHATFDAVAVLGWSGHHSMLWVPPGTPRVPRTYLARGTDFGALTREAFTAAIPENDVAEGELPPSTPGFHHDDVPAAVVARDMIDYPGRRGDMPEWGTALMPPCAMTMMSPGSVAPEAASIRVPVLVGLGERDVCPDPLGEPRAYPESPDVTVVRIPRMAHMHNFAGTRERLWARIHAWGEGVAATAERG
jgi:alpha-beta hydrolase superfamily lysophospholipase